MRRERSELAPSSPAAHRPTLRRLGRLALLGFAVKGLVTTTLMVWALLQTII